jgi:hypothetical protein
MRMAFEEGFADGYSAAASTARLSLGRQEQLPALRTTSLDTAKQLVPERTEYTTKAFRGANLLHREMEQSYLLTRGVFLTLTTVSNEESKGRKVPDLEHGARAADGDEDGPESEPEPSPVA